MPRILLVDDEKHTNEALKKYLERRGVEVSIATTVDDALSLLQNSRIDLVLLDMFLNGQSGAAVLRTFGLGKLPCPFIVMSGTIDHELMDQVRVFGVNEFLSKPVALDEVYRTVCQKLGITGE
jgi:two-component system response regulator HydG